MGEPLIAFMTVPDPEEASRLARSILENRLAACCNLLGNVHSIYRWEGKVEESAEVLIIIKTASDRFEELKSHVAEVHSYDTPELIALPIVDGLPDYLQWIKESIGE